MSSAKKKAAKKAAKTAVKKTTKKAAVKRISTSNSKKPLSRSMAVAPSEQIVLDDVYSVDESTNEITLAVIPGDKGQTSDMTIKLDDKVIAEKHAGNFGTTSLGTNQSIIGKKLGIVATIADTSEDTNVTSLKIELRGGMNPEDYNLSKSVSEKGRSIDYICNIEFIN